MKKPSFVLGAALIAVLAGCAAPVKPDTEREPQFERDLGQAIRARYWAIQALQQPHVLKP